MVRTSHMPHTHDTLGIILGMPHGRSTYDIPWAQILQFAISGTRGTVQRIAEQGAVPASPPREAAAAAAQSAVSSATRAAAAHAFVAHRHNSQVHPNCAEMQVCMAYAFFFCHMPHERKTALKDQGGEGGG